ncbi:MAG: hypothetical protein JJU46_09540 [Balneolaceae bacterium]|nr:hypothetical protein [Balneolaceae bacterium]MCH8550074.1 hypothetical protein [Balneolaceae bacterium]
MILLDRKRIARTSKRMAYQILEEAGDSPICLIGLNERGFSLANEILPAVEKSAVGEVSLSQIDAIGETPFEFPSPPVDNSVLIFIDDVIFSGSTMQNAMEKVGNFNPFRKILVAVLADRGHRKFPIRAEIVGSHIPTKLNEHLEMRLKDNVPFSVELLKPNS